MVVETQNLLGTFAAYSNRVWLRFDTLLGLKYSALTQLLPPWLVLLLHSPFGCTQSLLFSAREKCANAPHPHEHHGRKPVPASDGGTLSEFPSPLQHQHFVWFFQHRPMQSKCRISKEIWTFSSISTSRWTMGVHWRALTKLDITH